MNSNRPELLSPAGDRERLVAAVRYGADAVYLAGKQFGMRSAPDNFGPEELADAVAFCHGRGVKVYLTCNTLPTNEEADRLPAFLTQAADAGVDAFIVSDVGVLGLAKRVAPEVDVHISTQAGVVNYLTATECHHLGASRVILARELSLDAIAALRDKTPPSLEIEAFVHGAMCVSFSGRCLLSQYMTGRDGNRGQCAQSCRWRYALMEETRPGQYFPVYEEDEGTYILNAYDLCTLPYLDRLARAGISSFKIEGRAKSSYYVAVVTNAYRTAIDLLPEEGRAYGLPDWLLGEVDKVSHRPYSTGFYFPELPALQSVDKGGYVRDWDIAATVDRWENGLLTCVERNRFFRGDTLELLEPGKAPAPVPVTELWDEDGAPLELANHPMMVLRIPYSRPVREGAILRVRKADD